MDLIFWKRFENYWLTNNYEHFMLRILPSLIHTDCLMLVDHWPNVKVAWKSALCERGSTLPSTKMTLWKSSITRSQNLFFHHFEIKGNYVSQSLTRNHFVLRGLSRRVKWYPHAAFLFPSQTIFLRNSLLIIRWARLNDISPEFDDGTQIG